MSTLPHQIITAVSKSLVGRIEDTQLRLRTQLCRRYDTIESLCENLEAYGERYLAAEVRESARKIAEVRLEIAALQIKEHLVETNDGTFGAEEAGRKIGTADPKFATRRVYKTASGARRETGPSANEAPGYTRHFRTEITEAKASLRDAQKHAVLTQSDYAPGTDAAVPAAGRPASAAPGHPPRSRRSL